ncbi:HAD family hydrolase [Deinococcus sp. HMF7604]|uniref:HAD family hydrolase n=1 Tax=Deinococcus betulae TaxID=2873312 RepID=UPI001CC9F087|nr:HAD family hydrolase [Deinococcus betulae]MBZ9751250.1 HAD family hydrolase [Deinococcus betulae]
MLPLLIWDFDGTLAHRPGLWSGALLDVLDQQQPGHGVTLEALRPGLAQGFRWHHPEQAHPQQTHPGAWWAELDHVFLAAYKGAGVAAADAAALVPLVRAAYLAPAAWRLYPETLPVLQDLQSRGWRHVVLSNHVPELEQVLDALGLTPLLDTVYTSAALGWEKPHPEAFRAVLRAHPGAAPVWMIGDSLTADVQGAGGVGLPAILVRSGEQAPHVSADLWGVLRLVGTPDVSARP